MTFSPLTIRRLKNFRSNKRGYYSTLIFCVLFFISIFAEFIANDKPIFVFFEQKIHFPVFEKARLIYGFRISVFFGLTLTILSSFIGILAGGVQGFYGGRIDLFGQRLSRFGLDYQFYICS